MNGRKENEVKEKLNKLLRKYDFKSNENKKGCVD